MRHIRLLVEHDGAGLCGWQRQANGPTVQGHLEAALAKLLARPVTRRAWKDCEAAFEHAAQEARIAA